MRGACFLGKARLGQTSINNKLRLGASCFEGEAEFYSARIKILEFIDANYQFVDASDRVRPLKKRIPGEPPAGFKRIMDSKAELDRKFEPMIFKKVESLLNTKRFRKRRDTIEELFPFEPRTLTLTDISFERFHGGPHRELSQELAMRCARGQDPTKFSRDPYLQLEEYYRHIGEDGAAVTIHYEGHCAVRQNAIAAWIAPEQGRFGRSILRKLVPDFVWKWSTGYEALEQGRVNWSLLRILVPDLIWKWSTGYGHRMWRLVVICLCLVAMGTVVYWSDNALVPPHGVHTPIPSPDTWYIKGLDRTVYSGDLLLPALNLRAGDIRIPNPDGWFYETYEAIHQLFGYVLLVLVIAWLTAVAKGDRRDR
jgi:hypothetical protein